MSGKLDQQSVTATSKSSGKLRFSASGGGGAYRRVSSGLLQVPCDLHLAECAMLARSRMSSLAKVVAVMWKEMSFLAWFMSQEKIGHSMPYLCWNKKKKTKSKPEIKKRLFFKKVEKQSPANALGEIEGNAPGIVNSSNNYQGLKQKRWNCELTEATKEIWTTLCFLLHQFFLKMVDS
ncbi:hypothetical protein GUJ93_ZPchr0006g40925 [Zizania palustris]|uniref:Uncharacterized protein n=1 Tax=Zizania palustris TaxID=103762 RepID=A0A8J5T1S9_ZIZPA|nr:hypothetical protein GUJ93_ZPchr0006g40925 [Zizania palustris]